MVHRIVGLLETLRDVLVHLSQLVGMTGVPHHGGVKLSLGDTMFYKDSIAIDWTAIGLIVRHFIGHHLSQMIVIEHLLHLRLGEHPFGALHFTRSEQGQSSSKQQQPSDNQLHSFFLIN